MTTRNRPTSATSAQTSTSDQAKERARRNATARGTKETLRAPFLAIVDRRVRKAIPSESASPESVLVAKNALQLSSDLARGTTAADPFSLHLCQRFGVNVALAGFFFQKAAEAGFDTELGLRLLETAHRCEGRAARARKNLEGAAKLFAKTKEVEKAPGGWEAMFGLQPKT